MNLNLCSFYAKRHCNHIDCSAVWGFSCFEAAGQKLAVFFAFKGVFAVALFHAFA